jgi:glutamine amidotransferase
MKCFDDKDILNETIYEYSFVSAVQKENITGVQYHPEKSHEAGERFLKNFADL